MSTEINPGTLINNRYTIQKTLGKGGFGRTYLASDTQRFNELCVLKEFLPNTNNFSLISKSKQLFEREAKVLYRIQHPQIPQFLALFTQNEQLFIVQEYINGKTYLQILGDRLSATGKPFSEMEVRQWLLDMLAILEYIHGCNIIHRDISLENVMLPYNQTKPVLIDFGVVKEKITQIFLDNSENNENSYFGQYSTKASVVGKTGYSPPEQLRLGQCYPASDIYALAVCAVILLTGKMPNSLMDNSLNWQWQSYVKISDSLTGILNKMLAELPMERYQSAKEVVKELGNNQSHSNDIDRNATSNNLKPKMSLGGIISSLLSKNTQRNKQQNAREEYNFEQFAQTPVSSNPQFLEYIQRQLSSFVGPLASVLIRQALEENPDIVTNEFVEVLAKTIPDVQRAEDFRNHIQFDKELKSEKISQPNQLREEFTNSPAISNPDFLEHCRREFSSFVGPFASVVIRDTLEESPDLTPKELVESLVAGIPNRKRAKEFERRILEGEK